MSDTYVVSQSPKLPSGEVITAKNTLQSFVASSPGVVLAFADPVMDLPSVDAQLYDGAPTGASTEKSVARRRADPPETREGFDIPELSGMSEPHLVAQPISQDTTTGRCTKKKLFILSSVIVLLMVAIGVGIGAYCASSGACSSTSESKNDTNSNVEGPSVSDNITAYVNSITLSGRTILLNGTSPEELALQFVVNDYANRQNFYLDIDQLHVKQRYALSTLLFQGHRPEFYGSLMENASINWLSADHECVWSGVSCADDDSIINITLPPFNGDEGSIPSDLALLTSLKGLYFDSQNFIGTIPNAIGQLEELEYLHLEVNNIGPTIPPWIQWLTKLTYLDLGDNLLTGTIPFELGKLTALQLIYLKDNTLTGSIQSSFAKWTSLEYFGFSRNQLTGTLPSFIGSWTNITYFGVSINHLEGTIPESIGTWSQANKVYFYGNDFTGTVPMGICAYNETFRDLIADCDVECSCCTNCTNFTR